MNTETLERLLMDRALGELPEDSAKLLESYLALRPEHARLAIEIEEMIVQARRVLRPETQRKTEPLPPRRIVRSPRGSTALPIHTWARRLAVAAAIGVSFYLGTWYEPKPRLDGPETSQRMGRKDRLASGRPSNFWAVETWRRVDRPMGPPRSPRFEWSSPVSRPIVREK
jgi:hypothetical protein